MPPLVSTIVPVHNTAQWLPRCLDSICGQTLENIEIICVNDGSTDESGTILEGYARRDTRVLTISIGRNAGVSVARNIGLSLALGEWVGFVDSDDSIEPDFYEKLIAEASKSSAEIIKGVRFSQRNIPPSINRELNEKIKLSKYNFCYEWTTAIYKTAFLRENTIRFLNGCIRNEDVAFAFSAAAAAKEISLVDDAVYNYFFREGSANTKSLTLRQIRSILSAYEYMTDAIERHIADRDIYVSEYAKIIDYSASLPLKADAQEKMLACQNVASTIIKLFKKNRAAARLFQKLSRIDPELARMLRESDEGGLANYVILDPVGRLRHRARKQLKG